MGRAEARVTMTTSRLAAVCLAALAAACAGPSIHLEPRPVSQEEPLAFELHDWDWNRKSFELSLRVTNHGDRAAFVVSGFLNLNDGSRSMAPTSKPRTTEIGPGRTRKIYLRYPAVDEGVAGLTLEFGSGAISLDEEQGQAVACAPLRFQVGDGAPDAAAAPAK